MSLDKKTLEAGLRAYLTGYGRNNRDGLAFIARYGNWPNLALRECEQRAAGILASLPDAEVAAIARLEIDLNDLARRVQADLDED